MKNRHQDGDDHPLTIEDILDETNQLDIGTSVKTVRFFKTTHQNVLLKIYTFDLVAANRGIAKQSEDRSNTRWNEICIQTSL